jgi:hypothetical protein
MLYVYAITDAQCPPKEVTGIQGAKLRLVAREGVAAVVSDHEELRLDPSEDLWAHEEVVEAAMEDGAVLPMRVGSSVTDDVALEHFLAGRGSDFARTLTKVRGAVEIGVRVSLPDAELLEPVAIGADPSSGTAYLMGRLARKQRVERLGAALHEPLCRVAREHTPLADPTGQASLRAAYLVDRDAVDQFRERVEDLGRELGEATLTCTGPWPPYSFTGGSG